MVPGRRADEETFASFVARSVDHLTRLGYLLSGDPERLVRDCLLRTYRSWPVEDPVPVLVEEFLARPGPAFEPGHDPYREVLRQALGELPPRQRAAVVLRFWAGLPADALVRAPEDEVPDTLYIAAAQLAAARGRPADDREAVLTAGLREVAAVVEPARVTAEEVVGTVRAQRRQRWRSVTVAAAVLVAAGVFAATLSEGAAGSDEPIGLPLDAPAEITVTGPAERRLPEVRPPVLPNMGPVVIDDQARRLTTQLLAVVDVVLPEAETRPGPAGPRTGGTERAAFEFYTRAAIQPSGSYLAQAQFEMDGTTALLLLEVRQRPRSEVPGYAPCPEIEQDCTFRQYPDRTRADVVVYTDPPSQRIVHSLSSLRPDGTYFHVTVYSVGDSAGPPPLDIEALFRFAQVFTF